MLRQIPLFAFIIFIALPQPRAQQNLVRISAEAIEIHRNLMELKLDLAQSRILAAQQKEPSNLIYPYLGNYLDCLRIYLSQDEKLFDDFEKKRGERLALLTSGIHSPVNTFARAEVYLQWSLVRSLLGNYLPAFSDLQKAYKLHKRNLEEFPHYAPSKFMLGFLHCLVGSIPSQYRGLVSFLTGMRGSVSSGLLEMEEVLSSNYTNEFLSGDEPKVIYIYALSHLANDFEKAWEVSLTLDLGPEESPLVAWLRSYLIHQMGNSKMAIELLEEIPKGPQYEQFHLIDYKVGLFKLQNLERSSADFLWKYVNHFRGENHIREAYQKLAWHGLIFDGVETYHARLRDCLEISGRAKIESDEQAIMEARIMGHPNVSLLKARLLFDGGNYQAALAQLKEFRSDDINHQREFSYRMGRIHQGLGNDKLAITYFNQCRRMSQFRSDYFSCNAALMCGQIYEKKNEILLALESYRECLQTRSPIYEKGIHQKARAAISRLSKD